MQRYFINEKMKGIFLGNAEGFIGFKQFKELVHVLMLHFASQKIDAQAIEEFYGLTSDISKNSESGYILFYQSRD